MDTQIKWFHAIGACGKATANVAKMFKDMGWFVTGTDVQFIPPASQILIDAEIPTEEGYHYTHLTKKFWEQKLGKELNIPDYPTLGLIVESASSKNKEYLFAKKQNIDIRPFSQILRDYLVKPESIVVVGTAGKTTTTALTAFMLKQLQYNPSYMIGADVIDFKSGLENTNSNYSVLEGDEYYSKELSTGAKFLQYKPKYGIITKISWEHVDVYPTEEEYINEFKKFVEVVPSDGLIIAKLHDKNIDEALENFSASLLRYCYIQNESEIKEAANCFYIKKTESGYSILNSSKEVLVSGTTNLLGNYNLENILAAFLVYSQILNLEDFSLFAQIVAKFKGPKKRLEHLLKSENIIVIDDFGVAPERAANSLMTLKQAYPDYRITAVFEPNSGSRPVDKEVFNKIYKDSFKDAYNILIPTLSDTPNLIQTNEFVENLKELKFNVAHVPTENLIEELKKYTDDTKTLIVFFSAYRLTEIAHKFVDDLKNKQIV